MSPDHEHEPREYLSNMGASSRHVSADRMRQFEDYVAEILSAFGMDPATPATRDTPRRFLRAMFDSTDGYEGDPKLITVFDTECRGGPDCRLS